MEKSKLQRWVAAILVIPVVLFPAVCALAGGTTNIEPPGAEGGSMTGVLPPPGFYMRNYFAYYNAPDLTNGQGKDTTVASDGVRLHRVQFLADTIRPIYVFPYKISILGLEGNPACNVFIPWVRGSIDLNVGGQDMYDHHNGLGDVVIGGAIGWHTKNGLLHLVTGFDFKPPSGQYSHRNLLNIGENDWSIAPVIAATFFFPLDKKLQFNIKADYTWNYKNNDALTPFTTYAPGLTGVRTNLYPGSDIHFDYSIDYQITPLGPQNLFWVGVHGYFWHQTTDDRYQTIGNIRNSLSRVFAIGPSITWASTHFKWMIEERVDFEVAAAHQAKGVRNFLLITHSFN